MDMVKVSKEIIEKYSKRYSKKQRADFITLLKNNLVNQPIKED